nr:MAG TPA: hypothetical protein [Caudoviricetes sp.]
MTFHLLYCIIIDEEGTYPTAGTLVLIGKSFTPLFYFKIKD